MTQPKGTLIIIGGHEERGESQKREILAEVASHARGDGSLVVVTVATASNPDTGAAYVGVFQELGVHNPRVLPLRSRDDALSATVVEQLGKAAVVFFTGGDQLRITSQWATPRFIDVCTRSIGVAAPSRERPRAPRRCQRRW